MLCIFNFIMEEESEPNALESEAQTQSGVIMKVNESEDGKISQLRSVQVDTESSTAKNDYSANEVLRYQDALHYYVL
jgi:hypothetical protein